MSTNGTPRSRLVGVGAPLLALSLALAFGLSLAPASGAATSSERLPPSLSQLSFMSGCWRGASAGGGTIEEFYTTPSANLILGATRYLRGGRAVDFEFAMITQEDSGIVLIPHPKGVRSPARFPLKELQAGRATWENLAHDFPKRIIYRRDSSGELVARVEGDGGQGQEWRMRRVDCAT